jgi:hypothetical protein
MTREQHDHRAKRRRWLVLGSAALLAVGGGAAVAGAEGGLTITPSSGAPGTSYDVDVTCGELPAIKQRHTQDGYVQMTIAPYGPDDVTEVSPSLWRVTETAGTTDEEYFAECGGTEAGTGRFDAESPHLWFGPRVEHTPYQLVGKTTVEGTDCPAGTEATVTIGYDGDIVIEHTAPIDEYGDWSVELPAPVGDTTYSINARCGDVTYDALQATTTATSTLPTITMVPPTVTAPTTTTTSVPTPAPATAQPGTADYTG